MKILKLSGLFLLALISFYSCQKEISLETGGVSIGTLKSGATGDCLPSTVNGIFKADSVLTSANYIDVQVNITNTGTYLIKSDTVNGYSFKAEGTLAVAGLNTVRLYPTGKPLAAGVNTFTIKYGASICTLNITVVGSGTGIAVYTLGGAPGVCTTPQINGVYTVGINLGATNTIKVNVNVTALGLYTFGATSTPTGMTFAAAGTFTTPGVQQVTLSGIGTPTIAGNIPVTVTNGSNTCTFTITVLPTGGGGSAVFTLNNAAGVCSGAIVAGTYTAGTILNAANTVTLNATVVTPGTYNVLVTSTNGYSFTGAGTFTGTGPQTIILTGTGTPAAPGTNNFTATAGTTTCTFSITVGGTAPPLNLDYIPETVGSNWSYKLQGGAPADTLFIKVSANPIIKAGNTYKIFEYLDNGTPTDSALHRKSGSIYYEYIYQDLGLDNPINKEVILLDSSLGVNATWISNLGNNFYGGVPLTLKITTKILAKGATATISSITYLNVIKVLNTYSVNFGAGDVDILQEEVWYAKGKGNIYNKTNDVPVTQTDIYDATRIQIN